LQFGREDRAVVDLGALVFREVEVEGAEGEFGVAVAVNPPEYGTSHAWAL
jgi:hypothetical protein